jgi:hypothetical protein
MEIQGKYSRDEEKAKDYWRRIGESSVRGVEEYKKDILDTLQRNQDQFMPRLGYMKDQTDINEKMRAILVDWIIEVHMKFKLMSETLYLTIGVIDRYLGK